jgi:hypothetical protein
VAAIARGGFEIRSIERTRDLLFSHRVVTRCDEVVAECRARRLAMRRSIHTGGIGEPKLDDVVTQLLARRLRAFQVFNASATTNAHNQPPTKYRMATQLRYPI